MNRHLKTYATTALFGLAIATAPAFADNERTKEAVTPPETTMQQDELNAPVESAAAPTSASTFADLDINADGFVTRDEVSTNSVLTQRFAALDANSDGKLSQNECSDSSGKTGCYR